MSPPRHLDATQGYTRPKIADPVYSEYGLYDSPQRDVAPALLFCNIGDRIPCFSANPGYTTT